ncbi:Rpn family recombination-promoting nuclease/putative transposase [Dubosiella newyorkensis]|uniref:Rpn family recombination-promoting nuclease/putative transposase n=1 Tax=Dubosiella newyorkensis TaxID=1862672 RepID=UPI0032B25364
MITFVLYFGLEKPWEKAKSIYELIEVPEALKEFIPDFRAKVIDLGALEDETIESFQSDMKEIVKFIKLSRQGKKEFTFKGMLNHSI